MTTEAQKQALKRYYHRHKAETRVIMFRLKRKEDADILDRLDSVPSKVDYFRRLVREDIDG